MAISTGTVLRDYCKYVYYAGAGDYWHLPRPESAVYKTYKYVSFSIYTTMVFLENLAALFGDFPEVERSSSLMFACIHDIVLPKMYLLLYHKSSVRKLNYEMARVGESMEEESFMKKQRWKVRVGLMLYIISVYLSLLAYGVASAKRTIIEGVPFYTVVTYLPYYTDDSTAASAFRIFFYMTWLYMMLPMMTADCFPITHLITFSYKFITLRRHFERIREEFDSSLLVIGREESAKRLKEGFLEGVRMHQKLLSLGDEINRVFGIIMSLQVCESSAVAVLLLLRLALSPHMDLTNAFMTYTFVGSLFLLLALNLWNAGEITYQASLLSDAMFNSGWHMCPARRAAGAGAGADIRRLVVTACAQAQKPLVLHAFGVQDLSYETFVAVARMTYSIFAVFYERGG